VNGLYQKIDQYLLTRYPRMWVLGIHIFLPIVVTAWIVLVLIGAVIVNTSTGSIYNIDDSFERLAVGMVLPVLLMVILFIIRQSKYNARRIHQHLPFKNRFNVFLSFWLILFSITSLLFAAYFGSWFTPGITHSKSTFHQDRKVLELGMSHFHIKGCFNDNGSDGYEDVLDDFSSQTYTACDYYLDKSGDSVNILRSDWYHDRYYGGSVSRVSIDQALYEIEQFIIIGKKYKAIYKTENAAEIFNLNTKPHGLKWDNTGDGTFYTHLVNLTEFETRMSMNESYHQHRQIFRMFHWEFWRYFSLIGFTIAFILIIYCSVDKGEFGWSMLVCALFPTVFGIIAGLLSLVGLIDGEEGSKLLLVLFIGSMVYVSFIGNSKPKTKRVFGISLNIILPLVVPIIFASLELDEDLYTVFAFITGLIVTYVYSFYYRFQYLHPHNI
jgi:hypothetical protein